MADDNDLPNDQVYNHDLEMAGHAQDAVLNDEEQTLLVKHQTALSKSHSEYRQVAITPAVCCVPCCGEYTDPASIEILQHTTVPMKHSRITHSLSASSSPSSSSAIVTRVSSLPLGPLHGLSATTIGTRRSSPPSYSAFHFLAISPEVSA